MLNFFDNQNYNNRIGRFEMECYEYKSSCNSTIYVYSIVFKVKFLLFCFFFGFFFVVGKAQGWLFSYKEYLQRTLAEICLKYGGVQLVGRF